MKRILIVEIEGKQCPCARERFGGTLWKNAYTCTYDNACQYDECSDENCPLPKVDGTTKRLLMMEVNPCNRTVFTLDPCPYMHHQAPGSNSHWKWTWMCNHLRNNPKCSDDNCPLPQIEPDKEEKS
jgi:hypothetical protein